MTPVIADVAKIKEQPTKRNRPHPHNIVEIRLDGLKKSVIKEKNGHKCVYCGCTNKITLTVDHIIPLSRGGEDIEENKQVCCFICNFLKGSLTDEEFKRWFDTLGDMKDLCKIRLIFPKLELQFNPAGHPDFTTLTLKELAEQVKTDEIKGKEDVPNEKPKAFWNEYKK